MKSLMIFLISAFFSIATYAQGNSVNVLKFLGIPVDGTKEHMIAELKKKAFRYDAVNKCLKGKFNGVESNIYISTNYGKVDRIAVMDASLLNETDIRIRYNNLVRQMNANSKYVSYGNEEIKEDEDISYEMSVKNKRYEAVYEFVEPFTEVEQQKLEEDTKDMDELGRNIHLLKAIDNKIIGHVWFMISEYYGKYYISMYYDNLKNRPNGEDL